MRKGKCEMRRILYIAAAILLAASCSGCRQTEENGGTQATGGDNSQAESSVPVSSSYESTGVNLFSTKDRSVIQTDFGYYIFQFDGNRLSQLEVVYDEETAEGAQALYETMTEPGYNQKDFVQISLSDRYVVAVAAESSVRYGYLFKMQKLDILSSFYNKQNEES